LFQYIFGLINILFPFIQTINEKTPPIIRF